MKSKSLLILIVLIIPLLNYSQENYESLNATNSIRVRDNNGGDLLYPWAGGLNSCQYGEIDMNMDGIKDLFVFDRLGNRIITFINENIQDSISYRYAPEYIDAFPALTDWVILMDYNLDGKEDIFTYSAGYAGIKVYKNISCPGNLAFELVVYPFLTSFQGGGYVNILTTYADYPAIVDLDNDGDLDILTFWGLGSFVEMHKNLSMEKYGIPDSLDYEKTQICWGHFAENDESNIIYLDTCFGPKGERITNDKLPHTGSTFLVTDLNGDGAKDLLLGDVDYPDLVRLMNGGTTEDAFMISQDWDFPNQYNKIYLFSMPACACIDVNNDGLKDFIVSPFDPGIERSENFNSSWLYLNNGTNDQPGFELKTKRFLQYQMIDVGSGAYPVLFDFNADGLQDLMIGNYGYYDSSWYNEWMILYSHFTAKLAAFENIGTEESPAFQLYDRDYADLSSLELTGINPAFADLDGDGDEDMLIGNNKGTLMYYENTAGAGNPCSFILADEKYQNIDVGKYSAPQLIDIDKDSLIDLVIGEQKGNLNYYKNEGTNEDPVFTKVTDSLGKVNVTDYQVSYNGYSMPFFFLNNDKEFRLIVGSEKGKLFYFKNIDGNLNGKFEESDSLFALLDTVPMTMNEGMRSAAVISDIDNDGRLDMIAGNYSGGLRYYGGIDPNVSPDINDSYTNKQIECKLFPVPAKDRIYLTFEKSYDLKALTIDFYNTAGQKVQSTSYNIKLQIVIGISYLNEGIYFLKINWISEEGIYKGYSVKKLIVSPTGK